MSEPLCHTLTEVLDEDVSVFDEFVNNLLTFLSLKIDRYAALVTVVSLEVGVPPSREG